MCGVQVLRARRIRIKRILSDLAARRVWHRYRRSRRRLHSRPARRNNSRRYLNALRWEHESDYYRRCTHMAQCPNLASNHFAVTGSPDRPPGLDWEKELMHEDAARI